MSDNTPPSQRPGAPGPKRSLTERVERQVSRANRALERRDAASRPRIRRAIKPREDAAPPDNRAPADATPRTPVSRELRALHVVYNQLGARHRLYREKTGERVSPALKAAVQAFKLEPSLLSLVPVAGFLDELQLLDW